MAETDWARVLSFRCTGCGNCCRGTYICITDEDARRLAEGTGRPIDEVVYFASPGEIAFDKRHPWWVKFERRRAVMTLPRRRGACTFLRDDNLCGVYEHRPLVCRAHPFDVTLTDVDRGGVEKITLSRLTHCPHEWDGHETRREIGRLERARWRESDAFIEKVAMWNRRRDGRRTPREFLRHLGLLG